MKLTDFYVRWIGEHPWGVAVSDVVAVILVALIVHLAWRFA